MFNKQLMLVMLSSLTLTACVTTQTTDTAKVVVVDTSCKAFKKISFDCEPDTTGHCAKGDTDQTVKEVRQHNAAWSKLCE